MFAGRLKSRTIMWALLFSRVSPKHHAHLNVYAISFDIPLQVNYLSRFVVSLETNSGCTYILRVHHIRSIKSENPIWGKYLHVRLLFSP